MTLTREVWKPVVGYENLYEVSNLGRVKNAQRKGTTGGLLFQHPTKEGYLRVGLHKNDRRAMLYVHRLVLDAFRGPAPIGHEASHINNKAGDNSLSNLLWETKSANMQRKHDNGTYQYGEKAPSAKLKWDQVREIRSLYRKVRQVDLAAQYGVHRATIQRIHSGERWHD